MNELFRFVSVRPPRTASSLNVTTSSELIKKSMLVRTLNDAKDKQARVTAAKEFRRTEGFVDNVRKLQSPLVAVTQAFIDLGQLKEDDTFQVAGFIEESAGQNAHTIRHSEEFAKDKLQLWETALALRESGDTNSALYRQTHLLMGLAKLIEEAAAFNHATTAKDVRDFLRRNIIELPFIQIIHRKTDEKSSADQGDRDDSNQSTAQLNGQAAKEVQQGKEEIKKRLNELQQARQTSMVLNEKMAADGEDDDGFDEQFDQGEASLEGKLQHKKELTSKREAQREKRKEARAELSKLSGTVKSALMQAGLGLSEDALPETIRVLEQKISMVEGSLQSSAGTRSRTRYTFYQGNLIEYNPSRPGGFARPGAWDMPGGQELPTGAFLPGVPNLQPPDVVPEGIGFARILGVGDLMLVREEPKKYELGEIAHIENIMAGEYKDRTHRRTQKTEESFSTVTERETEKERDLQSTERFQLTQEASEIMKVDSKAEAGFNLSASYGPTVSVGVNTSASLSANAESSKKSTSDFAREVTERAKNRVVEKVREERVRKTTEEIEEINKHGFDNKESNNHVVGLYRWVNKVMRARLLNYGQRLMLEFVIPEPSAFFMQALFRAPPKGSIMEKPDDLILEKTAGDILDDPESDYDYRKLASSYEVTDLEPPPLLYMQQAENFSYEESDSVISRTASKKITINEGYQAYKVVFTRSRATSGNGLILQVAAGSSSGAIEGHKREFTLNACGELPVSVSYSGNRAASVHVSVYCERTPEAYARWQIKMYKALLEGYQKIKSKFDEQIAIAGIRQANQSQGFSPERNRAIERNEIKRNVISMFTGQHFDLFGAIQEHDFSYGERTDQGLSPATQRFPEIDFEQAIPEGKYIQFFENSFEWSNMSYVFYPYFWGRKQMWGEKLGMDNTDPNHLAFLQAGAARVVAPVRPGFEPVLIHYLDTGEIWAGEDVPDLSSVSAPYIDIATEIREQQGNSRTEPIVVEEWDVQLPTSLVMLQQDAQLPVFIEENEDDSDDSRDGRAAGRLNYRAS